MLSRQSITLADQAPEHEKCLTLYQDILYEHGAGLTTHYLTMSPECVNLDQALPDNIQNYMDVKHYTQNNLDQRLNAIEARFYQQFDKKVIEIKEREELSVPEENVLMRPSVIQDQRCEVGIKVSNLDNQKKSTSGLITSQLKNTKISKSHSPIQRSGFNATVVSVVPISQIIRDSEEFQSLLAKSKQSEQHSDRNPMATITESSLEYRRAIKDTTTELELLDQRRSKLRITKHDEGYFTQFKNAQVESPALKKPRLKSPLTRIDAKGKSPDAFQTNVIKVNLFQKSKNWEVAVIEKSPVQKKTSLKNVKLAEHFKSLVTEQSQSMSSFHKDYRPFQDKSYFALIERLPKHKQTQSTADLYIPKHEKVNERYQAPKKDPQQFLETIQADQQQSQYQDAYEQEVLKTHHAPNVHLEDAPINPDTKQSYTRAEELVKVQQNYRNSINMTKPKQYFNEHDKEEAPLPYYMQQVQQFPSQSQQPLKQQFPQTTYPKQLSSNALNRLNNDSDSDEEIANRSSLAQNQKRLQDLEKQQQLNREKQEKQEKFEQEQKNLEAADRERQARIAQNLKEKEDKKQQAKREKAARKEQARLERSAQKQKEEKAKQESVRQERLKKSKEVNEQLSYQYIKDMDRELFSFNPKELNARDLQNIKIPNKESNAKAPTKINIDLRNFMIKPEEPPHRLSYSPPGMQRFERPGQKDMFINVKIQ